MILCGYIKHDNAVFELIAANRPTLRKLHFQVMTIFNYQDNMTWQDLLPGLRPTRLLIVIHGFVLEEDTQPVDERNLASFPDAAASLLSAYHDSTSDLKFTDT